MSKIVTGQSTDLEFLNAINEKGASLTANATPYELALAIDSTGSNVSYDSPNEVVVASVNSEIVPPTPPISTVPWSMDVSSNKLLFKEQIVLDFTTDKWQSVWEALKTQEEEYSRIDVTETGYSGSVGHILIRAHDVSYEEGFPIEVDGFIGSCSGIATGHLEFHYNATVSAGGDTENTAFNLNKESSYYESVDSSEAVYLTEAENIVELPLHVAHTGGGSVEEAAGALIEALVSAVVEDNN